MLVVFRSLASAFYVANIFEMSFELGDGFEAFRFSFSAVCFVKFFTVRVNAALTLGFDHLVIAREVLSRNLVGFGKVHYLAAVFGLEFFRVGFG